MSYKDVREWIRKVDAIGELKSTGGADWNLEMDDDIDVYDINDVLWAMCSQADPVDATGSSGVAEAAPWTRSFRKNEMVLACA